MTYKVPDEAIAIVMKKAVLLDGEKLYHSEAVEILTAFIEWQRKQCVPTDDEVRVEAERFKGYDGTAQRIGFRHGVAWILKRIMYAISDPLEDLLLEEDVDGNPLTEHGKDVNRRIREAEARGYQRGKDANGN